MIEAFHLIATFALGLLAGALLTEGAILVPYWRRMEPAEFLRLHGTMGPSLYRYFAPLTIAGVMLPFASGVITLVAEDALIWRIAAALLCLAALAIYLVYFKAANAKFSEHTISAEELPSELTRWAGWHTTRTIIVLAAFAISLGAYF